MIALELKSNQGTSISFAREGETGKDIKYSQIQALEKCSKYKIRAGLLLNFRKTNKTYWIDIENFLRFYNETKKKSINEQDLMDYCCILVEQTLKKKYYKYDLSFLWSEQE